MTRAPKTKIVATLGPSSGSYGILRRMISSGMDVARLNFSHGTHAEHLDRMATVRRINRKYRRHIRIMQDLEGFRIRVGRIEDGGRDLVRGERLTLTRVAGDTGPGKIPFDYHGNLAVIEKDQLVYIDDGNLVLKVNSVGADGIRVTTIEGGRLFSRKGINMPGVPLDFSALTGKDKIDIEFGIANEVDFIALSFVRNSRDVSRIRDHIKRRHPACRIISKIESREAVRNIDGIIKVSDGVMIARGDMGIAVPIYQVPIIQKEIIGKCNKAGKPVITATQMLESMTMRKRPSRAEVADVANAILDGTDYVMLSGETAAGRYPVESVRMMNDIIKYTESARPDIRKIFR